MRFHFELQILQHYYIMSNVKLSQISITSWIVFYIEFLRDISVSISINKENGFAYANFYWYNIILDCNSI